jgi:hypothetical protein
MGKISSYGTASAPSLGDKLIGTSVGGSPVNGTYNFTIQQLADLISGQVTLQEVLTAGNTATQSINLTGIITATTLNVGNITSTGILTSANTVINGYLKDKNASVGTSGQVLSSTVTGTQWITLPSTPTLQQVLNAGSTATHNISISGVARFDVGEDATAFSIYNNPNGCYAFRYNGDEQYVALQETTGNVLIGLSSVLTADKLQVKGDGYFTNQGLANVSVVATTSGNAKLTLLSNTTGSKKAFINAPLASGTLVFQTQNTDRMFIDSFGSVIINNSISIDPGYKFQVTGDSVFVGYSRFEGPIVSTVGLLEGVDNLPIATFDTSTGVFTYADGNLKVYSYGGINMQSLPESPSSTYGDLYVDVDGFVKIVR